MKRRELKTSRLSQQPGRFASIDLEKPFAHRARKRVERGKLKDILLKAFKANRSETGIVLGALRFLLGKAKTQVSKSSFKENNTKEAAVAHLLELMRDASPEVRIVIAKDGHLRAETPTEDPRDKRDGLNNDKLAVLYPSQATLYPHSTIVRLYK